MPPEDFARLSISLRGEIARALWKEYRKAVENSLDAGERRPPSMADIARDVLAEGLQHRGYDVENKMQWGGYRERNEDNSDPEAVAVAAH